MSDAIPLTYDQYLIYDAIRHLGPDGPMQRLTKCVRIRGPVNVEWFKRAAEDLVRRHPILCARLDVVDGQPVQRLGKLVPTFEIVTLSGGIPERSADALLSAKADLGFNLHTENPLRITLVRAGADDVFVLLAVHHLFLDAAGLGAVLRDYLELSLARSAMSDQPAHDHSIPGYLEYARLEQQRISDGSSARNAQYWISRLRDADPDLHIAGRGPEPETMSMKSVSVSLDGEAFTAFTEGARKLRVTQFALAASAIFTAIREITEQDRFLLGVIVDTRRIPFRQTVGQFGGVYPVGRRLNDMEMNDTAIKAVGQDIMAAIRRPVSSYYYYSDQIPWLRERLARVPTVTDVNVDFIPPYFQPSWFMGDTEYSVTPFYLTQRHVAGNVPYHGVVLSFRFQSQEGALWGNLHYESAIISTEAARAVATALTNSLCGSTP